MIAFGLTDDEQMIAELATELATELRAQAMAAEASGAPGTASEALRASGLTALAADDPDVASIGGGARMVVLEALAHGDAPTTYAVWGPVLAARLCRALGAPASPALVLVDDAGADGLPCALLGSAEQAVLLQRSGHWQCRPAHGSPTRALGMGAAGPRRVALGPHAAQGQAGPATTAAVVAEIRLFVAALLNGLSKAARDHAEAYVQERVTFGRRLADHQGVAFLVADAAMAVEGSRWLSAHAAEELGRGAMGPSTDAYLEAVEVSLAVTSTAVQLLGGHGFMKDHPVERWMRDARALSLQHGGVDAARADAAEAL